jgi:hypothetical protein
MVLYRINSIMSPLDPPFGFRCEADDGDHAEEQCLNAYPDCDVVWVVDTSDLHKALDDYYCMERN